MNRPRSKSNPNLNGTGTAKICAFATAPKFTMPSGMAISVPMTSPIMIAEIRSIGLPRKLSTRMIVTTMKPISRFLGAPSSSPAPAPPAKSVKPVRTRLSPMMVMTIPVTVGVMMRFSLSRNCDSTISITQPARQSPKIIARISSGVPPAFLTEKPAAMIAPRKAKLVPCRLSSPEPTGPIRRHWMKVATPETKKAMAIR